MSNTRPTPCSRLPMNGEGTVYLGYWDGAFQFGNSRGERKPPPVIKTYGKSNYRPVNTSLMVELRAGWH